MAEIRLTIIGGGSPYMTSMFTSLAGFAKKGLLADSTIILHDINMENARLMRDWGNRGAVGDKVPLKFVCEENLDKALDGADFVLSCIRPGGLEGRYHDESIPLKYRELGIETVGIGGIFMALRCLPVAYSLASSIHKICPEAWLINYTNPANMVTDVSLLAGHSRTIGLCDGVWGVKWLAAKLLNLPSLKAADIQAYVQGINHFTWATDLQYESRGLYDEMENLIADKDHSGKAGYETIDDNPELNEVEVDACRLFHYYGLLPGSVYYARYYYNLRKLMSHHLNPGFELRSKWLTKIAVEKRTAISKQLRQNKAAIAPLDLEDAAHGDQAIGVINALANDTGLLETVNIPNRGSVSFLPDDAVVEVTARLNKQGAQAVTRGDIPYPLQGMIQSSFTSAKLAGKAALTGDRKLVLQAAMAHPAHRDLDVIEKVIADLFAVHKNQLPKFQ